MQAQFVFSQPADHVEVHVGGDVRQRERRVFDKVGGADHPNFFSRPKREDDPAAKLLRFRLSFLRERSRQFQDRGRSGRVVVGAGMNFSFLAFPLHRAGLAETEMIVMRADHDIFGLLRADRKAGSTAITLRSSFLMCSTAVTRWTVTFGSVKPLSACGFSWSSADCSDFKSLPARRKSASATLLEMLAATIPEFAVLASNEVEHELALVWGVRSGDEQHGLRAMLARQHRLVTEPGVAVQFLPPLRIDFLRHVAQDERDLVLHIHAGIRIIAFRSLARHRQAVADKHNFAVDGLVLRERKRREIFLDLEPERFALSYSRCRTSSFFSFSTFTPELNSNFWKKVLLSPAGFSCASCKRAAM